MDGKLDKILDVLGIIQSDVAELKTDVAVLKTDVAELKTDVTVLKTDVAELKTTTERIENKLDMTFEAVAYTKEEVRDSRYQLDRHEVLLGEMAKALIEQNVRIARSM